MKNKNKKYNVFYISVLLPESFITITVVTFPFGAHMSLSRVMSADGQS